MKQGALLVCWLAMPAMADLLYDNTNLTHASSGIGPISQCTPAGCVQGLGVVLDDVLVPMARDPLDLPLEIQQVTVGISGSPGQSTDFTLWTAPVRADGSPNLPLQQVGTTAVTIGPSAFQNVTFGSGSSALFTVQPNFSTEPGFGLFYIGLSSSKTADWSWANGPDFNLPTAYFFDSFAGRIFLDTSSPGFPPNLSFAVEIEGNVVPEPSAVALLGTVITLLCWRLGVMRSKCRTR